jgi:hypothetical protein
MHVCVGMFRGMSSSNAICSDIRKHAKNQHHFIWYESLIFCMFCLTEMKARGLVHLVQDRGRCWFLVNTVMRVQVPLKAGSFLVQ